MLILPSLLVLLAFSVSGARAQTWSDVEIPFSGNRIEAQDTWYRCYVRVPDNMVVPAAKDLWRDSMMLGFSSIPGPFEVWLNGRSIIDQEEGVPEGKQRRFKVPKDILERDVFNVLMIRLSDEAAAHGLRSAPVYFGYHHELIGGAHF